MLTLGTVKWMCLRLMSTMVLRLFTFRRNDLTRLGFPGGSLIISAGPLLNMGVFLLGPYISMLRLWMVGMFRMHRWVTGIWFLSVTLLPVLCLLVNTLKRQASPVWLTKLGLLSCLGETNTMPTLPFPLAAFGPEASVVAVACYAV